jgi:hypothetical protein
VEKATARRSSQQKEVKTVKGSETRPTQRVAG